jgi:hypothetical protein
MRLWTGLLLLATVFGCGGVRTYSSAASGAAQNSPTPVSSPVGVGYNNFVSAKWLYSVQYPETWYEFPVSQASGLDAMKSFANENIESPEGMDSDGVFVTITVDASSSKPCTEPPGANDPRIATAPASIDGERTSLYLFANGSVGVTVSHNQWCYRVLILTISTQTRDKYNPEIMHFLSSFKFNR